MLSRKNLEMVFRIADYALLGIFNFVRVLARYVPPRALASTVDGIGYALYFTRKKARGYLLETLRDSLPHLEDRRELERIAKKAFGAPLRAMLDIVFIERYGDEILDRLILDEEALARYDQYKEEGKGLIMFSPHLGNMAIPMLAARLGRSYTPLVMAPENTPIPRYLTALFKLCEKLGLDREDPVFFTGPGAVEKVREHLRRGKVMGITYDLMGSTVVDLFGHPVAIASGIAHFACDTGAPILPGYLKRLDHPLDNKLVYCGELHYQITGDREADIKAILKEVVKKGEEMIRESPEQWIGWFGMRGWRKRAEKILRAEAEARASDEVLQRTG